MQQYLEFAGHHPFLFGGLLAALIALVVTEGWRAARGERALSADEAIRLMNTEDAVVVDLRSASDYKKSHIINARHVPLAGLDKRSKEIAKDKERVIICYDGMGNQAMQAVTKLRAAGHTRVHALKGGFNAWQGDGRPVTRK